MITFYKKLEIDTLNWLLAESGKQIRLRQDRVISN